ncbi:MAG: VWA domain-containing protein [Chloroflexota bacterium]
MAIEDFRYSMWDGSQDVPDFTADDVLERMADDLLRGGDPQKALRNMLRRGFELPDGRRFQGMQRLRQQMREYRESAMKRYDPNGIVDRIREQLDEILQTERGEIDRRRAGEEPGAREGAGAENGPQPGDDADRSRASESVRQQEGVSEAPSQQAGGADGGKESRMSAPAGTGEPTAQSGDEKQGSSDAVGNASGQDGGASESAQPGDGQNEQFQKMLERMLERKEEYLEQLPGDNAGRIHSLREYDFLSSEAREAFENLIGGMQRELMEQYFQGLKQGIGQITPEQMDAVRQMVRDLNEMLEASQRGDRDAFDRFMDKHRDHFPPGIESLEDLMEHLQRQASAMQALLDSMDPEQRAELEAMTDELLRDDRLRMDLARLGAQMAQMGYGPRGGEFSFQGNDAPGFGESLDMMRRLQAMQDLENAIQSGDPFNALANAGGHSPNDLFGPKLGGQIEAVKEMAESLLEAGYLQQDGDKLVLTARAIRKLGDASLREIFAKLREDRSGGHTTPRKGAGGDVTQESRPYQFGDPFHVDIKGTVMNGITRGGVGTPVRLAADDFAVFETERSVQHATVLALDMSHSMYLNGLFLEAKKTALALDSLIRGQFPRDALYLIGFANVAFELQQEQLPGLMENDYVHGTNYEMALSLARKLLARHRGGNRQILFVTDGEPTACTLPDGRILFDWPPHPLVLDAALAEAARCAKEGITINTFVLDPDPRVVSFVEEMTAVNKGRMFLAGPHHLGEQVVLDYLHGRSVRTLH